MIGRILSRVLEAPLRGRATRRWATARLAAARLLSGDDWADGLPAGVSAIDEDGRHYAE